MDTTILPPSPSMADLMEDPDLDIDWDGMSVICSDGVLRPSRTDPCPRHNDSICLAQKCIFPHICSACRSPKHTIRQCGKEKHHRRASQDAPLGNCISFSPWARLSENAKAIPPCPAPQCLPAPLVKNVTTKPTQLLFKVVTPIKIDVFENLLQSHPNRAFVDSVVQGLREGFWPRAILPNDFKFTNESVRQKKNMGEKLTFAREQLAEERKQDRFSASMGRRLPAGMTCMPVHVALDRETGKQRLIYAHNSGEHSLNSLIPKEVKSGSGESVETLLQILRLRNVDLNEIVLFKSDVKGAFRIIPMSPYWQALQAVRIEDNYYIDRCCAFGNAASQHLFSAFFSLVLWIAEKICEITDLLLYVDDHFSWEYANEKRYYKPYSKWLPKKQAKLLTLWDLLGIPHKESKQEYGAKLTIVGLEVDLGLRRLTVPADRKAKLLSRMIDFVGKANMGQSLKVCQKIAGDINWALSVSPLLRLGMRSLHDAMAAASKAAKESKSSSNVRVQITNEIREDIRWMVKQLKTSEGQTFESLYEPPGKKSSRSVYVHATETGFGIFIPVAREALYHHFDAECPSTANNLTALHMFATVCALWKCARLISRHRRDARMQHLKRLIIITSDKGLSKALEKLSASPAFLRRQLLYAIELCVNASIEFETEEEGVDDIALALAARVITAPKEVAAEYQLLQVRRFIIPSIVKDRTGWIENEDEESFEDHADEADNKKGKGEIEQVQLSASDSETDDFEEVDESEEELVVVEKGMWAALTGLLGFRW